MAYVPRAIRDRARADRLEDRAGSSLELMRRREREFGARAILEREGRYPALTADNVAAAMDFQARRIRDLREADGEYQQALRAVQAIAQKI